MAEFAKKIKSNSSHWIHEENILHRTFAWQEGYAAFSVSESSAANVSAYISSQVEHHRKMSFQEELLAFLKKDHIPYAERYIWT